MNFYSVILLAVLAVAALAAPQRVIEKTTIIRNGGPGFGGRPGFGGPGFNRGPSFGGPGFNRGPGFGGSVRGPTVIKQTIIRPGK
ncbi:Protein CBG27597 [Caenorhabditis briggsae]|uniref:Protein CBG27597 n=1 Tax=Caenorhabditis briggsae TaxID=6238 RepID=B6IKG7_CAEBR|nr:Protein CBG27597 [Caenorhabditis briggsae]CAS00397.1 Protein CBG27597 [Caenorhabditis briggsae]